MGHRNRGSDSIFAKNAFCVCICYSRRSCDEKYYNLVDCDCGICSLEESINGPQGFVNRHSNFVIQRISDFLPFCIGNRQCFTYFLWRVQKRTTFWILNLRQELWGLTLKTQIQNLWNKESKLPSTSPQIIFDTLEKLRFTSCKRRAGQITYEGRAAVGTTRES